MICQVKDCDKTATGVVTLAAQGLDDKAVWQVCHRHLGRVALVLFGEESV